MAAKINQPSPQIFTSDPLEQIMGKGVLDRDMGGLAYMFLNAFGDRRRMDQDTYMKGVSESNNLAAQAAAREEAVKRENNLVTAAIKLLDLGQSGDSMPVLSNVIRNGSLNEGSNLNRALIQSKIAANNAGGAAAGDKISGKVDIGPGGSGFTTYDVKGRDPAAVAEKLRQLQIQQLKASGLPTNAAESASNADAMLKRRNDRYGGNVPQ